MVGQRAVFYKTNAVKAMKTGSIVLGFNAKAGKLQAVADLLKIHCCQYGNSQIRFAYMIFSLVSPCVLPSMLVRQLKVGKGNQ